MSRTRPFLTGLAGGGLLAAVVLWAVASWGNGEADSPAPGPRSAVVPVTQPISPELAELRLENARLRAAVAETETGRSRSPASLQEDEPPAAAAPRGPALHFDEPSHVSFLLAEFEAALRSGAMRQWLVDSPIEAVGLLTRFWMSSNQPERALALLENVELPGAGADFAQWIGASLQEKGETALATTAFLMGLRESPQDWSVLASLFQNAPDAALAERAALEAVYENDSDFRAQTALLKIATGQEEAGYAVIDAMIEDGSLPDPVWDLLMSREPAAAESRLRELLDSEHFDPEATRIRLVEAVRSQGRREDSMREIERLLELYPENVWAADALGELNPSRALAWLEGRLALEPTAETQAVYGEQLLRAGRTQEGIGALMQAWQMAPDEGYAERLLELIPERIAPRLLQEAARTRDDELYGDIADALWRIGRREEAHTYWQRASRIDPTDSEWIDKLRAVAQGLDPLQ